MSMVPNTQEEFRDHVVSTLAVIQTVQTGILEQLKKMNGTQARLLERASITEQNIITLKHEQETHVLTCPVNVKVNLLEADYKNHITEINSTKKTNKLWLEWLKPAIFVLAGAVLTLLLFHIDVWFKKLI